MLFPFLSLVVLLAPLLASLAAVVSRDKMGEGTARTATFCHLAALGAAIPVLVKLSGAGSPALRIPLLSSSWDFLSLGLSIDRLSAVMMVLITGIGAIIHLYSRRFMQQERGDARFHALLSLAISVLLFMVSCASLSMLFVFWQLLSGILSLLAYNYAHPPTAQGSFRTFVMLRMGDVFFLSGIVLAYHLYGTLDLERLFSRAAADPTLLSLGASYGPGWLFTIHARTLLTLLLFVGAMSKSAQVPLHMWLPDSLYAPTPVHALLHAGIINAGGFLINRLAPLYAHSPATLHLVFVVGLFTALLGASMMLTQNDIKKTLGYSTIGQMGYMIMECGLGAFALAVFHLIAHGLFKATIFLNCGNVIHSARKDPRHPGSTDPVSLPEFSLLPWATGLVTTLILPLIILLSLHGILAIPSSESNGEIIFLFFSWITSAQAILTLYRLRALGSWKASLAMLLVLGLVITTYLVAVKRFVFFLYPDPRTVADSFRAGALPGPVFTFLIAVGSLSILVYWISVFAKSHGRPAWISSAQSHPLRKRWAEAATRLSFRFYLFFMNRLYLDDLLREISSRLSNGAKRLDRSPLFLPLLAALSLSLGLPSLASAKDLPGGSLLLLAGVAALLPLFPAHGIYLTALTRIPRGLVPLPALLALALPALGVWGAAELVPRLPDPVLGLLRPLALAGALYGMVKALVQTRAPFVIAYASLSLYGILWWFLLAGGPLSFAEFLFAGAAAWTAGGLLFAWDRLRIRYGELSLTQLGGLARPMPRLSFLTGLLLLCGSGLPPFGLFIGFLALLLSPSGLPFPGFTGESLLGLAILLFVWFMASWILYRLLQSLFFGPARTDIPYEDLRPSETAPLVIAVLILLFFALVPYGCPKPGATGGGACRIMGQAGPMVGATWPR